MQRNADGTRPDDNHESSDDPWDKETLQEEADEAHRASSKQEEKLNQILDEGLDLELISIRLQKGLINAYKELARREGIGYQPLMRQVLTRYIREHSDS